MCFQTYEIVKTAIQYESFSTSDNDLYITLFISSNASKIFKTKKSLPVIPLKLVSLNCTNQFLIKDFV